MTSMKNRTIRAACDRPHWFVLTISAICAFCAYFAFNAGSAFAQANEDLVKLSQDANQWVIPLGNYSGTRHSSLTQITAQNVSKLHVAWTMSTGALRGHEGQPLVVGNM